MKEAKQLEQKIAEFKASLEKMSFEELDELEKKVIEEAEAADKEAAEKTFVLKDNTGKPLSATLRAKYGSIISTFLAKQECTWSTAILVKTIIDFWNSNEVEVKFPVMDNTLRMLGQVKFTGKTELAQVMEINDFFECIHDEFMAFTNKLYDIAHRHSAIIDEKELRQPGSTGDAASISVNA